MPTNNPNIFVLLVCGGIICFCVYKLLKILAFSLKIKASKSWPQAPAVVTNAKTGFTSGGRGGGHHFAEITYSYHVLGNQYLGKYKMESSTDSKRTAYRAVEETPAGTRVFVHYNPKNLRRAMPIL